MYTEIEIAPFQGDAEFMLRTWQDRHGTEGHYNDTIGVTIPFDEIESTGYGFWVLLKDGKEVGRVNSMSPFSPEENQKFRSVQFDGELP